MMSNLRSSAKSRAFRGAALVAVLLTVISLACSTGSDGGPSLGGSSSGGAAGSGAGAGTPSTGGVVNTGGVVATGGAVATAGAGGIATAGSAGTSGQAGGGRPAGGTSSGGSGGTSSGGSGGTSNGGSAGAAGSGPGRTDGCTKTSTLSFSNVPGESGEKVGTGAGGYVRIGNRGFAMRLPDNYDNTKPYWLVFGFHWRGGNAAEVDSGGSNLYNMAHYGLQKLSNSGAIFVAPDGLGGGWSDASDLKFVDDMIKLIGDNYCVDTKNIFANGFSWGGAMSYALACARSDVFKAVAIYNGGAISGCEGGTKPIAYWQMHGLTDDTFRFEDHKPMRDKFVANNGCTPQTPPEPPRPPPYLANGGHICTTYSGCSTGHPVRWCAHQSGHGNAVVDGTESLWHDCATAPRTCSDTCKCSWVPGDVWTFFNSL